MPAMWKTGDGRVIPVTDMDDKHLRNARRYMQRKLKDTSKLTPKQISYSRGRLKILNDEINRRRGTEAVHGTSTRVDRNPEGSPRAMVDDGAKKVPLRYKLVKTKPVGNLSDDELIVMRDELERKLFVVNGEIDQRWGEPADKKDVDAKLHELDEAMDALADV